MRSLVLVPLLIILSTLTACDWRASQKPSVLVIAVEALNSEAFFCGETDDEFSEGLGILCAEGVRFTHAFTPSTMSQSALASIMTGRYPIETGVVHNGSQYLSEKFITAAELAFHKGYRTAFFSGGAPIWSKSGLDQGFELFDDNIRVTLSRPYRTAEQNFTLFENWLDDIGSGTPYFSTIYLSDLLFQQTVTVNDAGQERALGLDSQLLEVNETLANLIAKMKQRKVWDNTYVFIAGLNGWAADSREDEISTTNLHGEGAQVLLLVKPARKARDRGISWTIDANVSLVDVGYTLLEIFDEKFLSEVKPTTLEVISLSHALIKSDVDWDRSRYILSESAWPAWRGVGSSRFSIRQDHWLYLADSSPKIYNTLTDRFENQPFRINEKTQTGTFSEIQKFLNANDLHDWSGLPESLVDKMRVYRTMANSKLSQGEIEVRLAHLVQQRVWDKQVVGWLASLAIDGKNWTLLEDLGREHSRPFWVYISKRMRNTDLEPPRDNCWQLLNTKSKNAIRQTECSDKEFLAFVDWVRAGSAQRPKFEEKFLRAHLNAEIDERVAALNFQNGLRWDVDVSLPAEPRLANLALLLPENKNYRQTVENFVKRQ